MDSHSHWGSKNGACSPVVRQLPRCLLTGTKRPSEMRWGVGCSLSPRPSVGAPREAGTGLEGPLPTASLRGSQLKQVFRAPEVLRTGLAVSARTSQPTSRGRAGPRPSNFPHLCAAGLCRPVCIRHHLAPSPASRAARLMPTAFPEPGQSSSILSL